MGKQRVFLTGATGTMGFLTLQKLVEARDEIDLVVLALDEKKEHQKLKPYIKEGSIQVVWGDLTSYENIKTCVAGADIVLHVGALVSPKADARPKEAMRVNYGSTVHIVRAIKALGQINQTRLVYIGTIAETGDRMPPIHWGRVGDPIKPSVFDYYAVSKVAAERHVIESGLPYWVSLRQTGIMSAAMAQTEDAIMFHSCLDNAMEYVSDRDSARLLYNLCLKEKQGALKEGFWGHVFNIGGGESCRITTYNLYQGAFQKLGIGHIGNVFSANWFATRNFHGQYYLDSNKLNDILDFRRDGIDYFYKAYFDKIKPFMPLLKIALALPKGEKLVSAIVHSIFLKIARRSQGTVRFIEKNMQGHIAAYWGSHEKWEQIGSMEAFDHFKNWDQVVHIDHGYDEEKPQEDLSLEDMEKAAAFRGGKLLSQRMKKGNWHEKLQFLCAFGHQFDASPCLVLEGGHWCPVCEKESWNYYERAKVDSFFAQVWNPLHPEDEAPWVYPKEVREEDAGVGE